MAGCRPKRCPPAGISIIQRLGCQDFALCFEHASTVQQAVAMDKQTLKKKIYAKIDELPTLPVVVSKLLALLEDPEFDIGELTELISQDPALTAKVLKVANSAYYGFAQEIDTLDRAVALLGINMLKSLVLSVGVVAALPKARKSGQLDPAGLWLHCVAAAAVIREMAVRMGLPKEDDHLFVVGLLHDVGKIVLLHFFFDLYQEALKQASLHEDLPLYMAEREIIGMDHGDVGAMLLGRWKFPPQVIKPIMAHHHHDVSVESDPRDTTMLRLANQLPQLVGLGRDGNSAPPQVRAEDMGLIGFDQADLEGLIEFTKASQDSIQSFFEAIL
jgi:putative nucleotidyltransferase with HDIG domain